MIYSKEMGKKNKNKKTELVCLDYWSGDIIPINPVPNKIYKHATLDEINYYSSKYSSQYPSLIQDLRTAGEVHRQARRLLQSKIKPNMSYQNICEIIETEVIRLFGCNDLTAGMAFPVGISVNNIAAHDSCNLYDTRVITNQDIVKIDFGTHVNGHIIDSAFCVCFDVKFTNLLEATKQATQIGIKCMGPDVHLIDISREIQEVIESYEIELDGKTYPIHAIKNLGGHNILPYMIHGNKIILCTPDYMNETDKMLAGELYAIETFATTGTSRMLENDEAVECNHFAVHEYKNYAHKFDVSRKLLEHLNTSRSTLPFASRWIDKSFGTRTKTGINMLYNLGAVQKYPPLVDKVGTYISQFEHTIYLHEYGKEVLSSGQDY